MKKLVIEDEKKGLMKLLGERITVYCNSFIYCGVLAGVNDTCILLQKAEIVYDTGSHKDKNWSVAEDLPHDWYVMLNAIESFGILKNGN